MVKCDTSKSWHNISVRSAITKRLFPIFSVPIQILVLNAEVKIKKRMNPKYQTYKIFGTDCGNFILTWRVFATKYAPFSEILQPDISTVKMFGKFLRVLQISWHPSSPKGHLWRERCWSDELFSSPCKENNEHCGLNLHSTRLCNLLLLIVTHSQQVLKVVPRK